MSRDMLNDVELTILSLVSESPRYGSEIERVIERRGLREWLTVGSASIYYILSRLEQQELLTSSHRADGDGRVVYQITDAGRGVAQTAVADLLSRPRTLGEGFALGLANLGILKPAQVDQMLIQHRDALTHELQSAEALLARRDDDESYSEGTRAMYSHSITLMQAELAWLAGFIRDWRERHPALVERDGTHQPDPDMTQTPLHQRTVVADRDKQIQRIKRPKQE